MSNLIEKLGITKAPWRIGTTLLTRVTKQWSKDQWDKNEEVENRMVFANFTSRDHGGGRLRGASTENKLDAQLIATAPEMLEALIEVTQFYEMYYQEPFKFRPYKIAVKLIEKATGKTWDEIKGMSNE